MKALGEVDEIGEAMLLVRIDLDVLVETIDEGGQPRLLAALGGPPGSDGSGRGGGEGIPGGREGELAAAGDEDTDESERAEGAACLSSDGPVRGSPRRRVESVGRGYGLRSPIERSIAYRRRRLRHTCGRGYARSS